MALTAFWPMTRCTLSSQCGSEVREGGRIRRKSNVRGGLPPPPKISSAEDLLLRILASGAVARDDEIIIIGSQSILGQFPDAPIRLLASMEADVFPKRNPEFADKIDGAIGEGSPFHEMHGYYAQGVGPETAVLPSGWHDRVVVVKNENTNGIAGLCLEAHDLAISKFVAGRYKDLEFIQELVRHEMIRENIMLTRLDETEMQESERSRISAKIEAMFSY